MVYDYTDFVNEAKMSEMKVGSKVSFKGKVSFYNDVYSPLNIDGATGVIKKITKGSRKKFWIAWGWETKIVFKLDKPIENINVIALTSHQLRNVEIIDDDYLKIKSELDKKLNSGEIQKYRATKDFMWIMRDIKFKKIGEYFDVSYFDVVKDNLDYISYIPAKKSKGDDFEKFRQNTRSGRVFRKLNPTLTEKEIEDFVNKYRASVEVYLSEPVIDVLTGSDISHWYNQKFYQKGGGTLNRSCMQYPSEQSRVKFYDRFPDKIALATYIKTGKLWARALVWRLDDGRVYMDRIYSVDEPSGIILEKYAQDHNMLMYKNRYRGMKRQTLEVTLNYESVIDNLQRPYFDSFQFPYRTKRSNEVTLTSAY